VLDGLSPDQANRQPASGVNSISWLCWHLTRIQDDHVAGVSGREQRWTAGGWAGRFNLPLESDDTGYGHSAEEAAGVVVTSTEVLEDYLNEVTAETLRFVEELQAADLERVIDDRWDPPVTMAVRLVSVVSDDLQHAGQAAYVKGLLGAS
jgi:uncharacterized damage-inducible protein DinB